MSEAGEIPQLQEALYKEDLERVNRRILKEFSSNFPETEERFKRIRFEILPKGELEQRFGERITGRTEGFHRFPETDGFVNVVVISQGKERKVFLNVYVHECIHAMCEQADIGRRFIDPDGNKKEVVYSNVGPVLIEHLIETDKSGRKRELYSKGDVVKMRLWEGVTEFRTRQILAKEFPQDFPDLHENFTSGYHLVSVVEWFYERAEKEGLGDKFIRSLDQGLINSDDREFRGLLLTLFSKIDAYAQLEEMIRKELELERILGVNKKFVDRLVDEVYRPFIRMLSSH